MLPWAEKSSTRPSNLALNASRDGAPLTSLGNLCQYSIILITKNIFLIFSLNLTFLGLKLLSPVLSKQYPARQTYRRKLLLHFAFLSQPDNLRKIRVSVSGQEFSENKFPLGTLPRSGPAAAAERSCFVQEAGWPRVPQSKRVSLSAEIAGLVNDTDIGKL